MADTVLKTPLAAFANVATVASSLNGRNPHHSATLKTFWARCCYVTAAFLGGICNAGTSENIKVHPILDYLSTDIQKQDAYMML